MSAFSQRLKAARLSKGYKQTEVAAKLGVSVQSYSAYENGREPNYKILCALCTLLDVFVSDLLGVENAKKSAQDDNSVFSYRLSELSVGKTQQEIATAAGVSRVTISYYQRGERLLDVVTLAKLATYFGVSSDYLIGLTDDPTPHTPNPPPLSNADIAALLNEIATIAQFRATRIKNEEEEYNAQNENHQAGAAAGD